MRDPISNGLRDLAMRCASLERRFRDLAGRTVRNLWQLDDVQITENYAPGDGDTLTFDADLEKWVARSGWVGLPCIRVATVVEDGVFAPWVEQGWLHDEAAIVGGTDPQQPFTSGLDGIWHVTVSVIGDGAWDTTVLISLSGPPLDLNPPDPPVLQLARTSTGDGEGVPRAGQASLDLQILAGQSPMVLLSESAEEPVGVVVTAHLLRELRSDGGEGPGDPGGPGGET